LISHLTIRDRQARILDPRMAQITALVAGAGMVGSWTALALTKAVGGGVHVWDDDTVEPVNIGVQAYSEQHVGMAKAEAVAALTSGLMPHVGRFPDPAFRPLNAPDTVVVCAVDSMAGRREIAEWSLANGVGLFIETGVQAELVVVKTAVNAGDYGRYLRELPSDEDVEEPQCGLKGTAYAGMSLGSQIVPLVNAWAAGRRLPRLRVFHVGLHRIVSGDEAERKEVARE
jgi:hypothetical protein